VKATDLLKILKADGWYEVRQTGSHLILHHPTKTGIVVVPMHGKKDIPIGTHNSILKQAGLK
jgi:predicted RNA binding protein YcfA (HicA-like mRNA interferase family)